MLSIRLHRQGKKNQPFYKIIVAEKQKSSTRGRFVDEIGFYNPLTKERKIEGEKVKHWISVGAKPTDTVHNMLVSEKIIEAPKIPKHKKAKKAAESSGAVKSASAEGSGVVKEEASQEEQKAETSSEEKTEEKKEEMVEQKQVEIQESTKGEEKEEIKQKAPEPEEKK